MKIIVLISIVIIGLIGGSIVALKIFNKTIEPNAISAIIKANNIADALIIPYNDSVQLSWESNNAVHCEISGDWLGIVSGSGSQLIGNIIEAKNYLLLCVNEKNETASSSVAVYIDEKTIPANATSTVSTINRESFKDFVYTWNKNFGFGLKNNQDVAALQTVLYLEELLPSSDQITGNFDEQTLIALKKFQEAYDIEQTGYAGNKTISKLNELYGAGTPTYYSTKSLSQQLVSGLNFSANELAETTATINLRDNNYKKIGTIAAETPLKIIGDEIKYYVIADKKFEMREVQIINTGQTSWIAAVYLKKADSNGDADYVSDSATSYTSATNTASTTSTSTYPTYPTPPTPPDNKAVPTDDALRFWGVVMNISPCTIPPKNNSIQILGNEGGRFIWVMGESQMAIMPKTKIYAPYTIPEVGMWLSGELGEEVKCYGAGGPGKIIKYAEYAF